MRQPRAHHTHLQSSELPTPPHLAPQIGGVLSAARGPPDGKLVLNPADIERLYGISQSTQAKGRMTGDTYVFVKRGRSVLAFRDDVERWLRGKLRRSTSDNGSSAAA